MNCRDTIIHIEAARQMSVWIGSIMTTEYVDLKKHMTVSEAFDRIRRIGCDKETIYNCYVGSQLQGFDSDFIFRNRLCILGSIRTFALKVGKPL